MQGFFGISPGVFLKIAVNLQGNSFKKALKSLKTIPKSPKILPKNRRTKGDNKRLPRTNGALPICSGSCVCVLDCALQPTTNWVQKLFVFRCLCDCGSWETVFFFCFFSGGFWREWRALFCPLFGRFLKETLRKGNFLVFFIVFLDFTRQIRLFRDLKETLKDFLVEITKKILEISKKN